MLNTKSCVGAALIWAVIVALVAPMLWDVAGLPPPLKLWGQFIDSDAAEAIRQFQTLIAGVVGFGMASFAYWLNGHHDRKAAVDAGERSARTLAQGLVGETERIEADCDLAAARLAEEAERRRSGDTSALPASLKLLLKRKPAASSMLVSAGLDQLASLGANASAGVLMLRNAVADLERETAELSGDGAAPGAADLKSLARAYSAVCLKCARVRPLLWTLARHGTEMAEARDPANAPSSAEIENHVEAASARTAPAASTTATPRISAVS